MATRVGTILHGALGDCYEQALCMKLHRARHPQEHLTAYFAVKNRFKAFRHLDLSLFDEVRPVEDLAAAPVEEFVQFQVHDRELQEVVSRLPSRIAAKLPRENRLPWTELRRNDFTASPLWLPMSSRGRTHLERVREIAGIDDRFFDRRFTVGFLWRYRKEGSINSRGQFGEATVHRHLDRLMQILVKRYDAHIVVCGMSNGILESRPDYREIVEEAGIGLGERRNTVTSRRFSIPEECVTYLPGAGYAVEMEIMSRCDLLLTMPSGFSEPLWMRGRQPTVMLFPPLEYVMRLWKHRMPFFRHDTASGRLFNTFTLHTPSRVLRYLERLGALPGCGGGACSIAPGSPA